MPYDPTIWQTGDVITAEKLNKIEQALVDLYEQIEGGGGDIPEGYVVVAPEQTVTIGEGDVELTVAEGTIVPYNTPVDWYVKVDGKQLEYQESQPGSGSYFYSIVESGVWTAVAIFAGSGVMFTVVDTSEGTPIPGTHTVEIYGPDYSDTVPAGYTSVAPKQGVTVGTDLFGVIISSENYTLPSDLSSTNWAVSVNDQMLIHDTDYYYEDEDVSYDVFLTTVQGVQRLELGVSPIPSEPVTYTVYIYSAGDR